MNMSVALQPTLLPFSVWLFSVMIGWNKQIRSTRAKTGGLGHSGYLGTSIFHFSHLPASHMALFQKTICSKNKYELLCKAENVKFVPVCKSGFKQS